MKRLTAILLLLTGCATPAHVERLTRQFGDAATDRTVLTLDHVERISRQLSEQNASWTYRQTGPFGSIEISRVNPMFGMSAVAGGVHTTAPTNMPITVSYQVAVPALIQTQPPVPKLP